ncbi:BatA domain-containing protein [Pontibacter liquoris]|uniref:BatA domain-containing protein n=1 Tax=Pontibacter liquoris TaxID=2905677 RepID=UPI001FA80ABE|nr:BatA domain-containing protein [Pontibacter liquoris]
MTFLYPSFLFALAAIAIPIILHLIQLRRAKRVQFSNVRFIQVSKDLTASQRNLKEWLILLCRVLFIVFLVLSFAQPFIPASDKQAAADTSHVTLWLDNSFSMQNRSADQDVDLLSMAVDRGRSIATLFPPTTSFSLIAAGEQHAGVHQRADVLATLNALSYVARPEFVSKKTLSGTGNVFLISDFQKSTFQPDLFRSLDTTVQLHLVPLQAAQTNNVAIDSVYLEDAFVRQDAENMLHIKLFNSGGEAVDALPVKLFIGGAQAGALSIAVPAKQTAEAVIGFRLNRRQAQQASVIIDDYPVEFDNTYYFTLAPSANITVIALTDKPEDSLAALYKSEPAFTFREYTSSQIDYGRLAGADVLLLNGLPSITPALAATVSNFVKAGGTVAVIPGQEAEAGSYANLFQNLSIPASITGAATGSIKVNVLAPKSDNPFFKSIFSTYDAKVEMPASVRTLAWSRASEDILLFRGGGAFLSRFDRGNGRLYLLAAPLEAAYNTLASHALFVPIMYKIAIAGYKQEQDLAYTLDNTTIQVPAAGSKGKEGVYTLKKDSLELIPEQRVQGGKLLFTVPPAMADAGFYTLQLQDSVLATLAFNYAKKESFLAQYTPDELRQLVTKNQTNVHVYDYDDAFSAKAAFEKRFFGVKLWKYCLILCLIFLMAEIALIRFL